MKTYHLKWSGHVGNMENVFGSLFDSESLADVTLYCGNNQSIKCHRLLLSTSSDYFRRLFLDVSATSCPLILLPDVSYGIMKQLVSFIYSGEVSVGQNEIDDLLSTASLMEIRGLTKESVLNEEKGIVENKRKLKSPRQLKIHDEEPKDFSQKINEGVFKQDSSFGIQGNMNNFVKQEPVVKMEEASSSSFQDSTLWSVNDLQNDFSQYMTNSKSFGSEDMSQQQLQQQQQPLFPTSSESPGMTPLFPFGDVNNIINTATQPRCPICGEDCSNFPNLRTHLQNHNRIKRYACDFCDSKFKRQSHLNRHRRIHTGEKPFECTKCGKFFSRQDKLKTHLNRHFVKEQKSAETAVAQNTILPSWNSSSIAFPSQINHFPPIFTKPSSISTNIMNYLKCQK